MDAGKRKCAKLAKLKKSKGIKNPIYLKFDNRSATLSNRWDSWVVAPKFINKPMGLS
jgi:hypothetical protein